VKVGLIVPGGFGSGGEGNTMPALAALVDELVVRHEVHVFAFASPKPADHMLGGAHIHHVEYPWLPSGTGLARRGAVFGRLGWQLAHEILRLSAPRPFEVLHAFWANEPGLLGGLIGRALKVPVVLSLGGGEAVFIPSIGYGGAGTTLGRTLGDLAFRLADEITAGTEFARSFLAARVAARTLVIPLGIAWRNLDASPLRPPGPPWRLLHVASLNRVKDQKTLLAAFKQVVDRGLDVVLDCVGEDTLHGEVQSLAGSLGLAPRVNFHGFLSEDRLAPFYRGAHLLVLSSRYESQGVVILEAAATGLPTVGTAVGLLPALAPAGARCVDPGDAAALADIVAQLLGDEGSRLAMGSAAQRFARAHDAAWTAQRFEEIYRQQVDRFTEARRRRTAPRAPMDPTQAYDLWSATYDDEIDNPLLFLDDQLLSNLLAGVPAVSIEGKVIADVGCGTGRHWRWLLAQRPARLIGFDVSTGMLARLGAKYPGAEVHKLDGYPLADTPDGSCDLVISTLTLGYLADPDAALAEWCRILKSGGDMIITDFHPQIAADGTRSFRHQGRTVAIRHYIHPIAALRAAAARRGLVVQRFEEELVDDRLKRFYETDNSQALFQRLRGKPLMYGFHLRKAD
jgi:glycosyltransferase involved in cell wall biosynthesis/ubiquinone/menaquinone biosynthesis C-methylase UbiE